MSVKLQIPYSSGIFFITFTNAQWIPLFKLTNSYDLVYTFFDYLKSKGHFINAFVIMPEHVHAIISFRKTDKSINKIIGDGKRFMTYEIVKRLRSKNESELLLKLSSFVTQGDSKRGKKHEAFEPSFDWKLCESIDFIQQKLDYIHWNPVKYKIPMSSRPEDYKYSSASNYAGYTKNDYDIVTVFEMFDINLEI
jgi:REP element-mobilizing transposase RayT